MSPSFMTIESNDSVKVYDLKSGDLLPIFTKPELDNYLKNVKVIDIKELVQSEDMNLKIFTLDAKDAPIDSKKVELLSEITHEVNNSLAIILTSIKVISKVLSKENIQRAELINNNFKDIENTVTRITNFLIEHRSQAKSMPINSSTINVSDLLNDLKNAFILTFKDYNIDFVIEVNEEIEGFKINSLGTTLYQCLFNLINNSFYELRNLPNNKNKNITINCKKNDSSLLIDITDNGNGIPKELTEKIFEKNFTSKGNEGSGLGLFLVKKYITLNNGEISLDTNYKKGAKFSIKLPLMTEKPSILCVDDDHMILETLKDAFHDEFNIILTTDARTALEIFKSQNIEVVISDNIMPNITGLELYALMKKEKENLHFILYSGHSLDKKTYDQLDKKSFQFFKKSESKKLLTSIYDIFDK